MSDHRVSLRWDRREPGFDYETYSRDHMLEFGSGLQVPVSAAAEYKGNADLVDPEQLLVGALASCHMLTFLAIAAKKRYTVDSYRDDAVGELGKNDDGRFALTKVTLRPSIVFSGDRRPDADALAAMHASAHKHCFIANSVTAAVSVEPANE